MPLSEPFTKYICQIEIELSAKNYKLCLGL